MRNSVKRFAEYPGNHSIENDEAMRAAERITKGTLWRWRRADCRPYKEGDQVEFLLSFLGSGSTTMVMTSILESQVTSTCLPVGKCVGVFH